ncbi:MAG: aminoglycoside phosphotransferase family protein [Chloroflexi bacterium]|nr:aminoglycoside phosphotransferase family protein [Chloroflexota bacterium]
MQSLIAHIAGVSSPDIIIQPRRSLDIQSNRLFDVFFGDKHWIAKEYLKPAEFAESPLREFQGLTLLSDLDIAPRPIHYEPHTPTTHPIVIYEYMEGEMWDRRKPSPAQLRQLADVWLLQANIKAEGLWMCNGGGRVATYFVDWLNRSIDAYRQWVDAHFPSGREAGSLTQQALHKCVAAAAALDSGSPLLCFNQSDTRFANVIQRPSNVLGLVDWEDCGLEDVGRNLAGLLLAPNQEDLLSFDEWQAFLEPVMTSQNRTMPGIEKRFWSYMLLTSMFWCGLFLSIGVGRTTFEGWVANGLPVEVRLQRYLARALAYPSLNFTSQLEQIRALRFFPDTAAT